MTSSTLVLPKSEPDRRRVLFAGMAFAAMARPSSAAEPPRAYDIIVHRNIGCSCCGLWTQALARSSRFRPHIVDEAAMDAVKRRLGAPAALQSCHTAEVAGFLIEGHVPPADILRLLAERPAGIRGLAVPGMPIGAPGMERTGAAREGFDVFAFRGDGSHRVFASHPR